MKADAPLDKAGAATSEGKCPVCGKPRAEDVRPFCSRRCRDVDLARWMSGSYAIAGEPVEVDDEQG